MSLYPSLPYSRIFYQYLTIIRHEHIYEQRISNRLIRSDEFPDDPRLVVQLFQGVKVVLCTLSSLSNPALVQKKVFSSVPVQNLVVDEASQIGVFEYMVRLHVIISWLHLTREFCFIFVMLVI